MADPISQRRDDVTNIEQRLALALSQTERLEQPRVPVVEETHDLSARELLQMAWDRSEEEIEALQAELRLLRQQHQSEERRLLARINEKKRLQRELLERAPTAAAG
jgi:bacterioferritin (cytochrome b1)